MVNYTFRFRSNLPTVEKTIQKLFYFMLQTIITYGIIGFSQQNLSFFLFLIFENVIPFFFVKFTLESREREKEDFGGYTLVKIMRYTFLIILPKRESRLEVVSESIPYPKIVACLGIYRTI